MTLNEILTKTQDLLENYNKIPRDKSYRIVQEARESKDSLLLSKKLIDLGVDAIMTDNPQLLYQVLHERGYK